jgi:hypothetical protein
MEARSLTPSRAGHIRTNHVEEIVERIGSGEPGMGKSSPARLTKSIRDVPDEERMDQDLWIFLSARLIPATDDPTQLLTKERCCYELLAPREW